MPAPVGVFKVLYNNQNIGVNLSFSDARKLIYDHRKNRTGEDVRISLWLYDDNKWFAYERSNQGRQFKEYWVERLV